MNKQLVPFEPIIENDLMLENTDFLQNKEQRYSFLAPYSPALSCAVPLTESNETLLIYQSRQYTCPNQTLTTLKNDQTFHHFFDYASLCQALKRFSCFGVKSFPIVSLSAALFPLGRARHATWINPLQVFDLKEDGPFTLVHLLDGPTIRLDVTVSTFRKRAVDCLCILAMLQRDYLLPGHARLDSPLDVLQLPNTPFLRSLIQQPQLQKQFPLPIRAMKEAYEKQYALQTILRFGQEELDQWMHASFYDALIK